MVLHLVRGLEGEAHQNLLRLTPVEQQNYVSLLATLEQQFC